MNRFYDKDYFASDEDMQRAAELFDLLVDDSSPELRGRLTFYVDQLVELGKHESGGRTTWKTSVPSAKAAVYRLCEYICADDQTRLESKLLDISHNSLASEENRMKRKAYDGRVYHFLGAELQ